MYCSVPVFLAHRPDVTYGFFLNAPGWAQIRAAPDSDTLDRRGRRRRARLRRRPRRRSGRRCSNGSPPWSGGSSCHRGGRSAITSRTGVRLGGDAARRRRTSSPAGACPCDAVHLDISYMDGHRVFTWDARAIPRSGVAGRRARTAWDAVRGDRRPGREARAGQSGLRRRHSNATSSSTTRTGELVSGYVWPGRLRVPRLPAPRRPRVVGRPPRRPRRRWRGRHLERHERAGDLRRAGRGRHRRLASSRCQATPCRVRRNVPSGTPMCTTCTALSMARAAGEAMARLRPDRRSFALTRSGFAGIQRHAAVWTGDNTSSWEHLRMSLPMLCNLGLSGVPFVGADIGGFWGDATPELFARWIQAGVLYPLMRGHSHKHNRRNEPWGFGEEVEAIARRRPAAALPAAAVPLHPVPRGGDDRSADPAPVAVGVLAPTAGRRRRGRGAPRRRAVGRTRLPARTTRA